MAKLSPEERLAVLETINELLKRDEAGENMSAELLACGRQLGDADEVGRRPGVRSYTHYSKEKLDEAKRNGINRKTFWSRITHYKWTEWEAANIPARMTRKRFYDLKGRGS